MFASFKNFVSRHRRKFLISGVVLGGAVLAVNYAHKKILEWQENEAKEFFKKTKKEQHFKHTERTCNQTIFTLSKALKETIFKILDSETILNKIRDGDGNRIDLWDELKIVVFAQICSLLYAGLMLVFLLRIQLNIIGGYMTHDEKESHEIFTSASKEKYLSLCQHFIGESVADLCTTIKKHSALVLKDISLKKKLTLQDIENIFWRLESSLNEDPNAPLKNLSLYLIPESSSNLSVASKDTLQIVLSETVQILKHNAVVSLVESCIKRAFSNSVDKIAEYYASSLPIADRSENIVMKNARMSSDKIVNVTNLTLPLAKLVPILHGLHRGSYHNGSPDPWIEQFIVMDQLNKFGEDVFETYSVIV